VKYPKATPRPKKQQSVTDNIIKMSNSIFIGGNCLKTDGIQGEWRRGLPPGSDVLLSGRVHHEAALRDDLEGVRIPQQPQEGGFLNAFLGAIMIPLPLPYRSDRS